MVIAAIIGRFMLKSAAMILLVSFLGAAGAMAAHIMYDGQAAFVLLLYTPVIYFAAVAGRDEFAANRRR